MIALQQILLLLAVANGVKPVPARTPPDLKTVSACRAVSRDEIEKVLGRAVELGRETNAGGRSVCDYSSGAAQVSITLQHLRTKVNVAAEIQAMKASIPDSIVRPAPGIGTAAFFLDIAEAGTQLHVIRDDRDYVLVSILGFGDAQHVSTAAEKIARKIIDRF